MASRCALLCFSIFAIFLVCQNVDAAAPTKNAKTECIPVKDDHSAFHCMDSEPPKIKCTNEDERCEEWASRGECTSNPQYMLTKCRHACDSCVDLHSGVVQIAPDEDIREAILSRLIETQAYMHIQADQNVKALNKCVNKHDLCTHWSVRGECETNSHFMQAECAPACKSCDKLRY
jgi:hypothetical protein